MPRQTDPNPRRAAGTRPPEMPPDPDPFGQVRPRPTDHPRHENAVPDDPNDPAQVTEAIEAESWGEIVEVERRDGLVDGDYNGAPELAGIEETRAWEGDAVEAMEGRDEVELRTGPQSAEEVLAEVIAERRQVLLERFDEARELGVEEVVRAALEASDPEAGDAPVVLDEDVQREQLEQIDAAIDELERRIAEGDDEDTSPPRR